MTSNSISKFRVWIIASRPKTLLAAFVPVVVGSSIAYHDGKFKFDIALVTLLCAIMIQIGTNFVNDLYDFIKGADGEKRSGPERVVSSGSLSIKEMEKGILFIFSLCFVLGFYLVSVSGWIILLIGIISIIAGIAYTAGPFPLAYNGLGDIASFIFFGFVGTMGTYYVQTKELSELVFWSSIPVGALITNILVVNNYRDRSEDKLIGKNTLAVILGEKYTRIQYVLFMLFSYGIPVFVYLTFKNNIIIFLPFLSLPLAIKLIKKIYSLRGSELNKTLELTAKLSALYGFLFALGILA